MRTGTLGNRLRRQPAQVASMRPARCGPELGITLENLARMAVLQ